MVGLLFILVGNLVVLMRLKKPLVNIEQINDKQYKTEDSAADHKETEQLAIHDTPLKTQRL